jgi:hypothetical protein
MNFDRDVPWKVVAAVVAAAVVVVVLIAWRYNPAGEPLKVHYPYWCAKCKAVFDVQELKEDYPKNWRVAPGGPNDSVVICPRCDEGWAYPVATCSKCRKRYVLYLVKDMRCPHCHPDVARAAKDRGVDLTPPEVDR